jgi:hypothetical protein
MGAYIQRGAVPFHMLVDLDSMKIVYRQTGFDMSAIARAMQRFLATR